MARSRTYRAIDTDKYDIEMHAKYGEPYEKHFDGIWIGLIVLFVGLLMLVGVFALTLININPA